LAASGWHGIILEKGLKGALVAGHIHEASRHSPAKTQT
jgi:hypothetical protein